MCGPVRAGGVRWGQLPQAFCLDPLVTDQGPRGARPWLQPAWRLCLGERHGVLSPTKGL